MEGNRHSTAFDYGLQSIWEIAFPWLDHGTQLKREAVCPWLDRGIQYSFSRICDSCLNLLDTLVEPEYDAAGDTPDPPD